MAQCALLLRREFPIQSRDGDADEDEIADPHIRGKHGCSGIRNGIDRGRVPCESARAGGRSGHCRRRGGAKVEAGRSADDNHGILRWVVTSEGAMWQRIEYRYQNVVNRDILTLP